jgi:hypothetical protein
MMPLEIRPGIMFTFGHWPVAVPEPVALWCVAVYGPGTIIAQPSKELAEQRASKWNEGIAKSAERFRQRYPGEEVPLLECHVQPWPWSAEMHADAVAMHGGEPKDIC